MANIVKVKTELIKESEAKKVDLIKPLINKVKLFDSFIGKVYLLEDASTIQKIKVGQKLILKRRGASYSKYEVLILNEAGEHVGFVPDIDQIVVSRLMDAGKSLFGVVTKITRVNKYPVVSIEIYMEDF